MPFTAVTAYTDLLPRLQSRLVGTANMPELLTRELKDAGRAFCLRAEAWQAWLDPLNLVAGQVAYTLVLDDDYQATIQRVLQIRLNTEQAIAQGYHGTRQLEDLYRFDPPDTLTLCRTLTPGQAVTDGLEVKVALLPSLKSEYLPDWFFDRFADALIARVVWRLASQTQRPWSDPGLAQDARTEWERAVARTRSDLSTGYKTHQGLEPA